MKSPKCPWLLLLFLVVAACGKDGEDPLVGTWQSTVAPYGTPSFYENDLIFYEGAQAISYTASVGLGPPGCAVTTDLTGTWQDASTASGMKVEVTFTWTLGTDVFSGCTDPEDNATTPYTADKLATVNGTAAVMFGDDDQMLSLTQSYGGMSYTSVYMKQ